MRARRVPAIYTGPPVPAMIRAIQQMTRVDHDGRRYFRVPPHWQWCRLRDPMDFAALNAVLGICERAISATGDSLR